MMFETIILNDRKFRPKHGLFQVVLDVAWSIGGHLLLFEVIINLNDPRQPQRSRGCHPPPPRPPPSTPTWPLAATNPSSPCHFRPRLPGVANDPKGEVVAVNENPSLGNGRHQHGTNYLCFRIFKAYPFHKIFMTLKRGLVRSDLSGLTVVNGIFSS